MTHIPAPAPSTPLAVIGDVHGRADLLSKALKGSVGTTILVGDYIDRGEDSAGVLRALAERDDLICLMGNHEEMLLKFLDTPEDHGRRWLRYGGLQTLASFGVTGAMETSGAQELERARDSLAEAMGPALIDWVRARPSMWQSGNVAITHAGADPAIPMAAQSPQVLRWGHPDFYSTPRTDGIWVVHGHTIVETPAMRNGRVSVDTGAYATGRLTMALITDQGVSFETVR